METYQLTENVFLKVVESKDNKEYYIMETYNEYEEQNTKKWVTTKKQYFLSKNAFEELVNLVK